MKKILASLIVLFALVSTSCAQSQKEEKKEESSVVQMNKQMFLDKVFDYTTGATEWKYQGDKPCVIDFYATWCGPCRMVAPIIDELAEEYDGKVVIGKCDVEEGDEVAAQFMIRNVPTIVFLKDGKQVDKHVGAATKEQLKAKVEGLL